MPFIRLLEMGIHPLRIADGFEKACEVAVKRVKEISKEVVVESTSVFEIAACQVDIFKNDNEELHHAAMTALGSKVESQRKFPFILIRPFGRLSLRGSPRWPRLPPMPSCLLPIWNERTSILISSKLR